MTLDDECNAFFRARPGWSRFNLEHFFRLGWQNGHRDFSGGTLANTTERVVYCAGRLAAARNRLVDENNDDDQSG